MRVSDSATSTTHSSSIGRLLQQADHVAVGRTESRRLAESRVLDRAVQVSPQGDELGDCGVHVIYVEAEEWRVADRPLCLAVGGGKGALGRKVGRET